MRWSELAKRVAGMTRAERKQLVKFLEPYSIAKPLVANALRTASTQSMHADYAHHVPRKHHFLTRIPKWDPSLTWAKLAVFIRAMTPHERTRSVKFVLEPHTKPVVPTVLWQANDRAAREQAYAKEGQYYLAP